MEYPSHNWKVRWRQRFRRRIRRRKKWIRKDKPFKKITKQNRSDKDENEKQITQYANYSWTSISKERKKKKEINWRKQWAQRDWGADYWRNVFEKRVHYSSRLKDWWRIRGRKVHLAAGDAFQKPVQNIDWYGMGTRH